jgi:RNA polymerase sigma-70 factor (ECF subfamily)
MSRPHQRARLVREALGAHESALVAYAERLLGDPERARDVVQDAFLKLCEQDPGELDGHVRQWLYTVCRNRALDVRRKESRMNPDEETAARLRVATGPEPGERLERGELVSRVMASLRALPAKQREVLTLKFQDGLSYREIAGVTDQPIGTVGWLVHEGVAALRRRHGAELGEGSLS